METITVEILLLKLDEKFAQFSMFIENTQTPK